MEIEGTTFGTITIDGQTYEHDVIIRLSGEVVKRKKKLSKKYYGTSHVLSKDEAKFVFEDGCEQLILGSGQMGNVHLSPEAQAYFAKKGCTVLLQPTPRAIHTFNNSAGSRVVCRPRFAGCGKLGRAEARYHGNERALPTCRHSPLLGSGADPPLPMRCGMELCRQLSRKGVA